MKKTKTKKITRLRSLIIVLSIFIGGSLYMALKSGIGPLSFLANPSTVNETKTICTRKTDGRKDCTTYETSTDDGVKTTTTHSEIISDTGGVKKVVEYKYDVVKTTPVDNKGVQTGNSTTVEVRKKVDSKTDEEEVLSTVTTVQKAPATDSEGKPVATGEVVSEIRTGDVSLGVTSYKSGDERTDEQKCIQDESGKANGNSWANGACIMKVEPRVVPPASSVSIGVNCDKGMCDTSGAPICYGSYASTGQYVKDVNGNSTGEYDCRLCGDNGSGGVGFTGGPQSCKTLLTQNKPVVLGPDANPAGLGLDPGVRTGSCLSKRGADWVLAAVGQPGEGPNEGKVCDVTGGWSDPIIVVVPPAEEQPVVPPATILSPKVQCHINHPGYLFGKNFAGTEVCLPNTATNQAIISNSNPCKPGIGTLEGKEVMISCSLTGTPTYTFCYGGTGTFDANGKCITKINAEYGSFGRKVDKATDCNPNTEKSRVVRATVENGGGIYCELLENPTVNNTPSTTNYGRKVAKATECDSSTEQSQVRRGLPEDGGGIYCVPIGSKSPPSTLTETVGGAAMWGTAGAVVAGVTCGIASFIAGPGIGIAAAISIPQCAAWGAGIGATIGGINSYSNTK